MCVLGNSWLVLMAVSMWSEASSKGWSVRNRQDNTFCLGGNFSWDEFPELDLQAVKSGRWMESKQASIFKKCRSVLFKEDKLKIRPK